jgi:hypothetical protein
MNTFCSKCGYGGMLGFHKEVTGCVYLAALILPQRIEWPTEPAPWRCCKCQKAVDPGPDWTGGTLYCSFACSVA